MGSLLRGRWWAFAAVAALALPAGSALALDGGVGTGDVATPAGVAGVAVELRGEPVRVGYTSQGTLDVGDDEMEVVEGVRSIDLDWTGAPLDMALHAGLRGAAVHHGLGSRTGTILEDAQGFVPAGGLPIVVYVGPEGADAWLASGAWPHNGGSWLIGGEYGPAMVWLGTWGAFGWGVFADDITLPETLVKSSDSLAYAEGVRKAHIVCTIVLEKAGAEIPMCQDVGAVVQSLVPNVTVHGELQDARVALTRELRAAATPPGAELPGRLLAIAEAPALLAAEAAAAAPAFALAAAAPTALPAAPFRAEPGGPAPAASFLAGGSATWVSSWLPLLLVGAALLAPILALYRRILPNRALAHPVRERLLEAVRAHPGIHESDLAREVGLRHNHVQYHLRVLEEVGIVETRHFGGLKCIFELGKLSSAEKAMAMAQRGRSQEVLLLVTQEPGIAQRELARRLGMSESSIKWHLDRLEGSGVVRTERARGAKRVWPALEPLPSAPAAGVAVPAPL
jgi:predicted transcriptional regulator